MKKILAILAALGLSTLALAQTTTCPTCPPIVSMPPGSSFYIIAQNPSAPVTPTTVGATRIYSEVTPQAGDSVTKSTTAFASVVSLPANFFTATGQAVHIVAYIDIIPGTTLTPQVQFILNGTTVLAGENGDWIGTALTVPVEYKEDFWIVATSLGTAGTIEVHGEQIEQQSTLSINNPNTNISSSANVVPFAFNTTVVNTLGFETGDNTFTGTMQQRELIAMFWP